MIKLSKYYVYAEHSLSLNKVSTNNLELVLLGYWINPHCPDKSNIEILKDGLNHIKDINSVSDFIYPLSGRFVLIVKIDQDLYVFNDASGFRQVFFTFHNENFYMSSNIFLFRYLFEIKQKKDFQYYLHSAHYLQSPTYAWPAGYTFYEGIEHLVPNHFLNVNKKSIIRFFPNHKNTIITEESEIEDAIDYIVTMLKNSLISIKNKQAISLSLTSGNDSRVLLSLVKDFAKDIYFWISYNSKKESDYFIPKEILNNLGLNFYPIKNKKLSKDFLKFYSENTPLAHNSWAKYNYSKIGKYPENYTVIRGASSETARNYYYPDGIHPKAVSLEELAKIGNFSFLKLDFLKLIFENWLDKSETIIKNKGYNTLDFIFWEHREGVWQAQNQLESDFLFDVFVPYNNREILDLMLSIPNNYRDKKYPYIYRKIIEINHPELLKYPINPPDRYTKFEINLKYYFAAIKYKINNFKKNLL
ncbi:MAG: hypothetical protein PHE33_03815 [Bacteroidales bacterium]|nr:hypothetical protein [Bacteroidales bacterium]